MTTIASTSRSSGFRRRAAVAAAGALTLLTTSMATTGQAEAGWRARYGWGVAAGIAGGLALGALAAPRPVYVEDPYVPVYGGDCYVVRKRVWTYYGWRFVRRTVCD